MHILNNTETVLCCFVCGCSVLLFWFLNLVCKKKKKKETKNKARCTCLASGECTCNYLNTHIQTHNTHTQTHIHYRNAVYLIHTAIIKSEGYASDMR